MTFDEFIKKYLGTQYDYDGVSGVQCVDFVKYYLYEVHGIKAGAWGNARDYWLSFESHPELTASFTKIKNTPDLILKKGDIVVWSGEISTSNDYGHIAVASGEGGKNYFYSYDQNWNSKKVEKTKHIFYAVYGVLRPVNISAVVTPPEVDEKMYKLTNVRGVYKGAGAASGRKKIKELTADGKKNATSAKSDDNAYLKAGTKVSVLETKLAPSGNLWARIPSGWLCCWERDKDKLFIK